MNTTATVEVNVWAIFNLLLLIVPVTRIADAMTFNLRDLNAHATDTTAATATCGLINLVTVLVRPVVGVSPEAITWVAVERSVRYNAKLLYQWEPHGTTYGGY